MDEVGDIPLNIQVKLLRAIDNCEINRVGGTTRIRLDVRIISATNKNMAGSARIYFIASMLSPLWFVLSESEVNSLFLYVSIFWNPTT